MLITTVIVSYNTAKLTVQAVESVIADAQKSKLDHEVIVVDNASTDDSVKVIKKLQKKHPQIKLIVNKTNLGFAKANNQAIKRAKGEYLLLLNSDTEVLAGTLKYLLEVFQKIKKAGIVSAYLLKPNKTPQTSQGGDLPSLVSVFNQMLFLDDLPIIGPHLPSAQKSYPKLTQAQAVGWVPGTAMMIKNEVIDRVGLLDEAIFMYGEDVDFCWRARLADFQVFLTPKAQVIHYGSQSSSGARAIKGEFKGLVYLFRKHRPHWQLPILKAILKLGAGLRVGLFYLLGQKDKAKLYKQVFKDLN